MKLTYHRCGDYLLPDLGLTEEEQQPLGKYGRMRLNYLKEHRPGLFSSLLLSGKLMEQLHEIDETCNARLELLIPKMQAAEGVTEALRKRVLRDGKFGIEELSADMIFLSADIETNG